MPFERAAASHEFVEHPAIAADTDQTHQAHKSPSGKGVSVTTPAIQYTQREIAQPIQKEEPSILMVGISGLVIAIVLYVVIRLAKKHNP